MKDRVPLYPGRVKLTPVAGQENTYDMTRADQPTQAGDPLNKATLWSDVTAALFGLGPESVPDDAFAWLGKYNQHWWRRRTFGYVKNETLNAKEVTIISGSASREIFYAKEISVNNSSGKITFTNQQSINTTRGVMGKRLQEQAPCYIKNLEGDPSTVYFLPEGCTRFDSNNYVPPTQYTIYNYFGSANKEVLGYPATKCASVITSKNYNGTFEYVHSSDRSAYPDSGQQGGYEYEYLGIPFENAVSAPSIAQGEYTGAGKYGSANKNSLSFSFSPAFLIITSDDKSPTPSDGYWINSAIWTSGATEFMVGRRDNAGKNTVELKNNTVSWYAANGSADIQLNKSGATYHYIAIG